MTKKKKTKESEETKAVEEATEVEETTEEVKASAEESEEEEVAEPEAKEEATASEEKSDGGVFTGKAARAQLEKAEKWLKQGNNRQARTLLVEVVERGAPLEERENALDMLRQIELDVNSLLVGAVAMLVLVLIPTVGLAKALWALPLLFPVLLPTIPGVVGMLSFWAIPFLATMSVGWQVKFFVPIAGFIIALVLLFVQRSSMPSTGSATAN